jgi:hypothetical protein
MVWQEIHPVTFSFLSKQKRALHYSWMECPFFSSEQLLNYRDIYCGGAFFTFLYVKANLVTFFERLEPVPADS